MAYTITSLKSNKPPSSSNVKGFYYEVIFSCDNSVAGKTTINWKLYGRDDGTSTNNWANGWVELTFSNLDGQGTVSNTSVIEALPWDSSGKYYFRANPLLGEGSVVVTHNASTGNGGFGILLSCNIAGYKNSTNTLKDVSETRTLTNNMPYTACSAPTSVTASGIITPNGSFTVSWSGAKAGTSNAISGYRVYYTVTSAGTAPTTSTTTYKDVAATASSLTIVPSLSSTQRGYKIVCGVVTKGSAGDKYWSSIKTGGSVTVNSLPNAPTVTVSSSIVPSNGGSVTFTVTAGSDNDSSQSKTLYYATSPTAASKTKFTSPLSKSITSDTTYYFWTYDGLEYSASYTSKTIIKNSTPTLTIQSTGTSLESVNNNSGLSYIVIPTVTLTKGDNGQPSNNTYNYYINYSVNNSTWTQKLLAEKQASLTRTFADVRTLGLPYADSGCYYYISAKRWDGVEWSSEATGTKYYITKSPGLIGIYNKPDYTNVEGFYSGEVATHFSKFLGFKFERDTGYNILKILNYPLTGAEENLFLSTDANNTYSGFTNSDNLSSSQFYNLNWQIGYQNNYLSQQNNLSITKIASIFLSNLNFSIVNFKYFTATGETSHSVGSNLSNQTGNELKNFGVTLNSKPNLLSAIIQSNENTSELINIKNPDFSLDQINFNLPADTLANAIKKLFNTTERNSKYLATMTLTATNDFGEKFSINQNFNIDFIEELIYDTGTINIIYKETSGQSYPINTLSFLAESLKKLRSTITFKGYNTNPIGQIQIQRGESAIWENLHTFSFNSSQTPERLTPVKFYADIPVQTISQIANSEYKVNYRVIITTDAKQNEPKILYNDITVRGHIPPTLAITSSFFDGKDLIIKYKVSNPGAIADEYLTLGNNQQISLYLKGNSTAKANVVINDVTNFFNGEEKEVIFENYSFQEGAEFESIVLGITTILTVKNNLNSVTFSTEKSTIEIIDTIEGTSVFNLVPTVAYRKNHLGVNVINPSYREDAIITIGETSKRNKIYYEGVDTRYCGIANFAIDCGSWSGIPGGEVDGLILLQAE